jgi:hypothetical protein
MKDSGDATTQLSTHDDPTLNSLDDEVVQINLVIVRPPSVESAAVEPRQLADEVPGAQQLGAADDQGLTIVHSIRAYRAIKAYNR